MTIQRRVWDCLKSNGPLTARELSERLGLPVRVGSNHPTATASAALYDLAKRGCVKRHTDGRHPSFVAIGRPPKDLRGKVPGSLLALRSHARSNMIRLHAKRGLHLKPVATTALEQAWGWLPSTSQYCDSDLGRAKCRLPVADLLRPEET